jgi:hypothetical protein
MMGCNYFLRSLILPLLVSLCFETEAQNIDVKSSIKFFEIIDTLQSDRPVSDKLWKQFISLDGNRLFIETNGVSENYLNQIRRKWETVFRPSMDSVLQKSIGKDALIDIYYGYRQNIEGLKNHVAWLQSVNIRDSMYQRAIEWLPQRMHHISKTPYVYFITIDHNGSANSEGILNSLWASYLLDRIKPGAYGGHEMHHFLRLSKPLKPAVKEHQGILRAFESLLTEGTADLVDMPYWVQTDFMKSFVRTQLDKSPDTIKLLSKEIEAMANEKKGRGIDYFDELFNGTKGHFPGYYLAKTIVEAGQKQALFQVVDNPFAFLLLYQKAVESKTTHPKFSQKAVQQIQRLEKMYIP